MASPRYRFGTHERGWFRFCKFDGAFEGGFKFRRLHIVGESSKTGIAPAEIDRIRLWMTQTTQLFDARVSDFGGLQRCFKSFSIKLGIMSRARNRADVDNPFHAMRVQKLDEFLNWAGRVPNCKYLEFFRAVMRRLIHKVIISPSPAWHPFCSLAIVPG